MAFRRCSVFVDALEPRLLLSTIPYSYTLATSERTSAGVYTTGSNPTLVRTLWSGTTQSAGTYNNSWNGLEDNGSAAPAGNYTVKVLEDNVQYTWEGVIGNTSSAFTSTTGSIWRGLNEPCDLSFSTNGGPAISALGYNEGQAGVYTFAASNPQSPSPFTSPDHNVCWIYAVTDNSHVYVVDGGSGWDTANNTFVESYNMNGTVTGFTGGTTANIYNGGTWNESYSGVIDLSSEGTTTFDWNFIVQHHATGLAVQQGGNVLAVSHGGLNVVNLFNKTTGASLGTISITAPGQVGFAPNGDLWVITGTSVERFAAATLGTTNTAATTVSGLAGPLALGVDPTTSNVLVADGGTSQQIKCYNSTGTLQWIYGTAGGYPVNGPAVTTNKFWFIQQPNTNYGDGTAVIPQTYLAVQPDGSWWVGDGGNDRVLHYSAARTYLGQISYIGDNHQITVDPNNPTHVFVEGWLQYNLNYSVPLQPGDPTGTGGNDSWTLVDNWAAGMNVNSGNDYTGFLSVDTLTYQGQTRTYGMLEQNYNGGLSGLDAVAILPASGPLQIVDTTTSTNLDQWMDSQGDLRYAASSGGTYTITQNAFAGWDSSGNLLWGSPTTLASAPAAAGTPMEYDPGNDGWEQPLTYPTTPNGMVISYNGGAGTTSYADYHLGGIPVGGTAWAFQTALALNLSSPDDQGHYTSQSGYGGHDGTQSWVVGQNIIWNYDGQYASFSNQYAQYWDDGLFIGQFGNSTAPTGQYNVPAGYAGNYGETYVVQGTDGNIYAFSADEGVHGGVAVWQISGQNTIAEIVGTGTLGQTGTVTLGTGAPAAPSNLLAMAVSTSQINLSWTNNATNQTGFVIDQATNSSFTAGVTTVYLGASTTSYSATGLSAGTIYYYRVRAINRNTPSANASTATATTQSNTTGSITVPDGSFTATPGNVINSNTGGGYTFTSPMTATISGWSIVADPSTANGGTYSGWEPYGVLDSVTTGSSSSPYNDNIAFIGNEPGANYNAFIYYPGELYNYGSVVGGAQPGANLTMTTTGINSAAVAGDTYTATIEYANASWSNSAVNLSANVTLNILANGVVVGTGTLNGLAQNSPWTTITANWVATSANAGQAIQLQVVANNFLEGPGSTQDWQVPTIAFTDATLAAAPPASITIPDGNFTDSPGNIINTNSGGGQTFTSPMTGNLSGWAISASPSTANGGTYTAWDPYGVLDSVTAGSGSSPYNSNVVYIGNQPASNYNAFIYYPGELYNSGSVVGGAQPAAALTMTTTGVNATAVTGTTYTASIQYANVSWSNSAVNPSANVTLNILANGVVVGTSTMTGLAQNSPWTPVSTAWTATSANAGKVIQIQVVANNFLEGPGSNQEWQVPTIGFTNATLTTTTAAPGLLSINKPATASSYTGSNTPANAVDGNLNTAWTSSASNNQWIYIDLGSVMSISEIKLNWAAAYGQSFQIQVSNDLTTWSTIYSTTTGTGGTQDLTGLSGSGRYIRLIGTQSLNGNGYSLWEFQIYGV
jgi:F5/8 type C domain/Fibronectin type III domain/FlgD Ig-like domain